MEEIQSTEVLDREILEDARKKAWRILKTADETIQTKTAEWEKKAAAVLEELKDKYTQRRELASVEILARLPLDKRRAKAEKIDFLLDSAVNNWYSGLSREKVLDLLKSELSKRLALCDLKSAGNGTVTIKALKRGEAEEILRAVLPDKKWTIEELPTAKNYTELILETKDLRIIASIEKAVDFFLHDKREELAEALLGRENAAEVPQNRVSPMAVEP